MDLHLKGKLAVVTGAASGIGLATARALLDEGAIVAMLDLSETVSERAADLAASSHHFKQVEAWSVDITDHDALRAAAVAIDEQLGSVDILIHCAAAGSGKFGFPFDNLTPTDWPACLEVNIMGTVNVAHAFAPGMRDRGTGSITLLSSVAGQIGSQTDPPYSAAKAAVINFAQCLAKDLAPHGVRVNTVCPGMVQTPLNESVWKAWHDQQDEAEQISYEEWAERKIAQVVPLGRWQQPEEIADLILFLSSDRATSITGQTMNVDGGFVMHW